MASDAFYHLWKTGTAGKLPANGAKWRVRPTDSDLHVVEAFDGLLELIELLMRGALGLQPGDDLLDLALRQLGEAIADTAVGGARAGGDLVAQPLDQAGNGGISQAEQQFVQHMP